MPSQNSQFNPLNPSHLEKLGEKLRRESQTRNIKTAIPMEYEKPQKINLDGVPITELLKGMGYGG